jgi:hypothetical protein
LGAGNSVIVTRGEVRFAQNQPGWCFMGIWSGMRLAADGAVDPDSGKFRVLPWSPDSGHLEPREFDWTPGLTT